MMIVAKKKFVIDKSLDKLKVFKNSYRKLLAYFVYLVKFA